MRRFATKRRCVKYIEIIGCRADLTGQFLNCLRAISETGALCDLALLEAMLGRSHDTVTRIGLWFCSFAVSVTLFSLLCCLPVVFRSFAILLQFTTILRTFFSVLQFMTMTALPAWFLYLPVVIAFKDAEQRRLWILMTSGTLIGPACLIVLGLIVQLRGGDAHMIRKGTGVTA